jgi:hypothetical protein
MDAVTGMPEKQAAQLEFGQSVDCGCEVGGIRSWGDARQLSAHAQFDQNGNPLTGGPSGGSNQFHMAKMSHDNRAAMCSSKSCKSGYVEGANNRAQQQQSAVRCMIQRQLFGRGQVITGDFRVVVGQVCAQLLQNLCEL